MLSYVAWMESWKPKSNINDNRSKKKLVHKEDNLDKHKQTDQKIDTY